MLIILAILALQTLSVTVPVNAEFQVSFDLEQDTTVGVRWICDGAILRNYTLSVLPKVPASTANVSTYTLTVPPLTAGSHSCQVSAFNEAGESKSAVFVFPVGVASPVGVPPKTPVNIRIVIGGIE